MVDFYNEVRLTGFEIEKPEISTHTIQYGVLLSVWSNGNDIALSMQRWGFDSPYARNYYLLILIIGYLDMGSIPIQSTQ